MNSTLTLIWIAGIITLFCVLSCIFYIIYKIAEAFRASTLMELDFPEVLKDSGKNDIFRYTDHYTKSTSSARAAMGGVYSENDIEIMRRKYTPKKLPKGRY